jgi:capsular exopolysaccharide synthesis family protein
MPTEGKSTTALNMAITMAEKGENVLIIDCDMRKPNVHNLFNIRNVTGLSSILGGINSDVNAAIHSSVRNNLDVMTAGPIPPNPAELLASQKMRELVHLISKYYDYIFLDTPPVNVVSDALLMNDIAAGIVLVVKEDSTSHPALKDALRSIEMANGKVLGFIKVGCNAKASKSYKSYKYGKYGEYGYGYGSGNSHSSGSDELNFSPDKEVNRNND